MTDEQMVLLYTRALDKYLVCLDGAAHISLMFAGWSKAAKYD